jgi:glyoxalase family protein
MTGIHHVTAISGKAARNLDIYTHVLGLRFVKKTVNFDDPGTYHLYYGDSEGRPGTILTFFAWEDAAPGRAGVGLTQETAFRVPASSIGYWTHRFVEKGVTHEALERRFGEPVLPFKDPDGLMLALVGAAGAGTEPAWHTSDIPTEDAIRGFHGATLLLEEASPTSSVLTDVLGLNEAGKDGPLIRFRASEAIGGYVYIRPAKEFLAGRLGRGSVHHIAFRAADDTRQAEMAQKLVGAIQRELETKVVGGNAIYLATVCGDTRDRRHNVSRSRPWLYRASSWRRYRVVARTCQL